MGVGGASPRPGILPISIRSGQIELGDPAPAKPPDRYSSLLRRAGTDRATRPAASHYPSEEEKLKEG